MITLALVGVGRWGRNILNESLALKDARIKYLCSPSIYKNKINGDYIYVSDYKKLADFKDISGVIIATPPDKHFVMLSFFLKKGVNILIEKPFVLSSQDALLVKNLREEKKNILKIGHVYLHNPAFKVFAKTLEDMNVREVNIVLNNPGENNMERMLWDWGPHALSMLLQIVKEPATNIKVSVIGNKHLVLAFDYKDISARITIGGYKRRMRKVTVSGGGYLISFNELAEKKVAVKKSGSVTFPSYGSKTSLYCELESFVSDIINKKVSGMDLNLGVKITGMLEQINRKLHRKIIAK